MSETTLMPPRIDVLDHGYVRLHLLGCLGDDRHVVAAARAWYGGEPDTSAHDGAEWIARLLQARPPHLSVFEFATLTFVIKAPLFIRDRMMRHHTARYGVWRPRRVAVIPEYYAPEPDALANYAASLYHRQMHEAWDTYTELIAQGYGKEHARLVLPSAYYTTFRWQLHARALMHYLTVHLDPAAQAEHRAYAEAVRALWAHIMPVTAAAWDALRGTCDASPGDAHVVRDASRRDEGATP